MVLHEKERMEEVVVPVRKREEVAHRGAMSYRFSVDDEQEQKQDRQEERNGG